MVFRQTPGAVLLPVFAVGSWSPLAQRNAVTNYLFRMLVVPVQASKAWVYSHSRFSCSGILDSDSAPPPFGVVEWSGNRTAAGRKSNARERIFCSARTRSGTGTFRSRSLSFPGTKRPHSGRFVPGNETAYSNICSHKLSSPTTVTLLGRRPTRYSICTIMSFLTRPI